LPQKRQHPTLDHRAHSERLANVCHQTWMKQKKRDDGIVAALAAAARGPGGEPNAAQHKIYPRLGSVSE
jgi:hypothetical protein